MKRVIVIAVLVLSSGVLFAQTVNEIPCWFLGSGGGTTASTNYWVRCTIGQPVMGMTGSPGHWIRHGYVPCNPVVTGVEEGPPPTPAAYALHQNSPNPFNPRTQIRYDVPVPGGPVTLRIYDIAGRHVRTLVDHVDSPGRHQVVWTGVDDENRPVASGLYISVLETPQGRFNNKMALVR